MQGNICTWSAHIRGSIPVMSVQGSSQAGSHGGKMVANHSADGVEMLQPPGGYLAHRCQAHAQ